TPPAESIEVGKLSGLRNDRQTEQISTGCEEFSGDLTTGKPDNEKGVRFMRRKITQTVTIGPLILSLLAIVGGLLNAQTLGNGIPDFSVGASSITGIPLAEASIRDLDGVRFVSEGLFTINDPRPLERAA